MPELFVTNKTKQVWIFVVESWRLFNLATSQLFLKNSKPTFNWSDRSVSPPAKTFLKLKTQLSYSEDFKGVLIKRTSIRRTTSSEEPGHFLDPNFVLKFHWWLRLSITGRKFLHDKCLLTLVPHFKIMQIFHTKHFSQTKPTYDETSIGEIKGTTNWTKNDWREKVFVCHDENFFLASKKRDFNKS